MSIIVKTAKKIKKFMRPSPAFISFSRRINFVKTNSRICAMTFDDGPMMLPASPDIFDGKPLTEVILDSLDKFDAKGTFDIIGTTKYNYPDTTGKVGSPAWGGVKFDHYPDFLADHMGGALVSGELIQRMIDGGHMLSNHGYRHIIFGKKPFVYGKREHFDGIQEVIDDTKALNDYILSNYGYKITMGRPPHYVDKIKNGFSSYDAYSFLGMQYLGASFDGGGWLPGQDAQKEAELMISSLKNTLQNNPDALCGKIIFQKDGYNMAKRTPIALALQKQLEILTEHGYKVVTVDQLMQHSSFSDLEPDHDMYQKLNDISKKRPCIFSDNCVRPLQPMTKGEFALLLSDMPKSIVTNIDLQKYAVNNIFKKSLNPSSLLTASNLSHFKDYFISRPSSMSRIDIIKQLII